MVFVFRLLARLPLPVLHGLGALAGRLVWRVSPRYRRHARENIALAGLDREPAVLKAAIAEAGKAMLELPFVWYRPMGEVIARVRDVQGWNLVEDVRAQGRPLLFLTPHLGCFEILGPFLGSRFPLTALYRPSKLAWLEACIRHGRGRAVALAAADRAGVKRLLLALKRKEAAILLPDQVPGTGEGVWAPFFGRPAYTMTLAARLTEVAGAVPLLAFAERLPAGAGYRLHFTALAAALVGPLEQRIAAINGEIERMICRRPDQYLWSYNRYKRPANAPMPPVFDARGESC